MNYIKRFAQRVTMQVGRGKLIQAATVLIATLHCKILVRKSNPLTPFEGGHAPEGETYRNDTVAFKVARPEGLLGLGLGRIPRRAEVDVQVIFGSNGPEGGGVGYITGTRKRAQFKEREGRIGRR